jgi:pyrroline-5-carboxylate reductase
MKVGFIGCGKMGEAMVASATTSKLLVPHQVFASDLSAERRRTMKSRYGINVYSKNNAIPGFADILVLSVKPQDLDAVLQEIASSVSRKHLIISIVAGKRISQIQSILADARIIRVMPNLACVVGEGMSVFSAGNRVTSTDEKTALRLLSSFGKVVKLPENQFDAVTALSGSGPAFFAHLMDGMIKGAIKEGLGEEEALLLAEQTMLGTSKLLIDQKMTPSDLVKAVASPKGTTAAGIAVLEKSAVSRILRETIKAAATRSRQLSKAGGKKAQTK